MSWDYESLKPLLVDESLPIGLVDMDVLEANVKRLAEVARAHGKPIRLATKSVRVPDLIRHILECGGKDFKGLMCYSVSEARFLANLGFNDFLVAYPTVQRTDLEILFELASRGKKVSLIVDSRAQLEMLEKFWTERSKGQSKVQLGVCIDVDMSFRPVGKYVHLGVRRSPVRSLDALKALVVIIQAKEVFHLSGVMGYEAQIAGLPDRNPFTRALNPIIKVIKALSKRDVARKRKAIAEFFQKEKIALEIFNGGGTGSLRSSSNEPWLTEVTAGSGFLQSCLFDYYQGNANEPAFCFALRITRIPDEGLVTCQSGGFIASGSVSPDKSPAPFLPRGLKSIEAEGFGEVQTPFINQSGLALNVGDPVLVRPAKAGEIAERFNEYLLLRNQKIIGRAKTYRGLGHCFY